MDRRAVPDGVLPGAAALARGRARPGAGRATRSSTTSAAAISASVSGSRRPPGRSTQMPSSPAARAADGVDVELVAHVRGALGRGAQPSARLDEHPRVGLAEAEGVDADEHRHAVEQADPLELGRSGTRPTRWTARRPRGPPRGACRGPRRRPGGRSTRPRTPAWNDSSQTREPVGVQRRSAELLVQLVGARHPLLDVADLAARVRRVVAADVGPPDRHQLGVPLGREVRQVPTGERRTARGRTHRGCRRACRRCRRGRRRRRITASRAGRRSARAWTPCPGSPSTRTAAARCGGRSARRAAA